MPITNPTQFVDDVYNIGNLGTSATVDVNNGMWQQGTLVTGSSITVSGYTVDLGVIVLLKISQDGTGGWGITWGGNLIFATNAETQPELGANVTTWFVLWSDIGDSNIYGAKVGGAVPIIGDSTGTSSAIVNTYARGLREAGIPTILPMGGVSLNQYLKDIGGYISGSVPNFLELSDTPSTYSGQGGKYVSVKSDVTGLEFVSVTPGGGGGLSGIVIYDDNIYIVTGTAISFDNNLSVTVTGSVVFVSANGGASSGLGVMTQDEGVPLGTGTIFNFVGGGVQASISGSVVQVFVTGAYNPELEYTQVTGQFSITATTEATAETIITGTSINYDGATPIYIEFYAPQARPDLTAAARQLSIWLYEDNTSIGREYISTTPATGGDQKNIYTKRRRTPTNGTHQYSYKASVNAGTGIVAGGGGRVTEFSPIYMRISRA